MSNKPFVIDPATIRPEVAGESDFFSWQLFRWVRKRKIYNEIWRWPDGSLFIGHSDKTDGEACNDGWLHGRMLRNLCCQGQNLEVMAWAIPNAAEDVTEAFWKDYAARGVCAIHSNLVHKWQVDMEKGVRVCEYCGQREKSRVVIVEEVAWVTA